MSSLRMAESRDEKGGAAETAPPEGVRSEGRHDVPPLTHDQNRTPVER